jgi:hypothetical protein
MEKAARIAVREAQAALAQSRSLEKVVLACFGHRAFEIEAEDLGGPSLN